jgi:hypothetical protein
MTIFDIMSHFKVDKPTAYGLIKFLEAKKLIVVAGSIKKPGVKGKGTYRYAFAENAPEKIRQLFNLLT